MFYRYLLIAGLIAASVALVKPAGAITISPGDLIKASQPSVYYYAQDGKRYVFPNEKTYFTWYNDFNAVKTISDDELAKMSLGGNVTYHPGVQLLKLTSDPKVYAVDAGKTLRWISNVRLAKSLYGDGWAQKVHDLPDPFFVNYTMGSPIAVEGDYAPDTVRDLYPTIQSTLKKIVSAEPAPIVPKPVEIKAETTLAVSKTTAKAGDLLTLTATASHASGLTKIELFFDGSLIKTCASATICTDETRIPISGVKTQYEAKVLATALDTTVLSQTATVTIDATSNGMVKILVNRAFIRSGQLGEVIIESDVSLNVLRTDIYKNGYSTKACASAIRQCRWSDPLTDKVGTVFEFYGVVMDNLGRTYRTETKTIAIGTNDSPAISFSSAKNLIYKGEMISLTATASDDDGIDKIEILRDDQVIQTCQNALSCQAETGPWNTASTLTFKSRATDSLGSSSMSETVQVTVQ